METGIDRQELSRRSHSVATVHCTRAESLPSIPSLSNHSITCFTEPKHVHCFEPSVFIDADVMILMSGDELEATSIVELDMIEVPRSSHVRRSSKSSQTAVPIVQ
jgi:hypothetical protein